MFISKRIPYRQTKIKINEMNNKQRQLNNLKDLMRIWKWADVA